MHNRCRATPTMAFFFEPVLTCSRSNICRQRGECTHQPPGGLDHRPAQQTRALLADVQFQALSRALAEARVEAGKGRHGLLRAESPPVAQLAEHHVDRHRPDLGNRFQHGPSLLFGQGCRLRRIAAIACRPRRSCRWNNSNCSPRASDRKAIGRRKRHFGQVLVLPAA